MRWEELFADLEAQARALERADDDAEIGERIRGEVARVTLVNRWHPDGSPMTEDAHVHMYGGVAVKS